VSEGIDSLYPCIWAVYTLQPTDPGPVLKRTPALTRIELLQGTLDLIVLQSLRWGPQHGYGLVQLIRATSRGVLDVDAGSIYPALHRLERQCAVKAAWELSENRQRVRVYRLTPAGRKQLAAERSRWEQLSQAMSDLFLPPAAPADK
jgi:PadR family transcriptional regulator PadR